MGSLLCEQQVQRPPWLQQQLSADRGQESEEHSLDQSDTTMLTLVTLDHRSQVHALVRLLAAVALGVGGARLAHRPAVLALRHGPALLVDVLEWPVCMRGLALFSHLISHLIHPLPREGELETGCAELHEVGGIEGKASRGISSARPPHTMHHDMRLVVCFRCCESFRCPSVATGRSPRSSLLPAHLQPSPTRREEDAGAQRRKSLTVMLAIAHTMASHAGLASPLFSVNKHGGWLAMATGLSRRLLRN